MAPALLSTTATLLVVDVQALTLGNARAISSSELIERISRLAEAFRRSGRRVAFVVSTGTPPGRTEMQDGPRRWPTAGLAIPDILEPQAGDSQYGRVAWSAFAGTDLAADMLRYGSTQLVVTGLATTFGVESTLRAAYDLGLASVVVTDAVSDPDPVNHRRAIEELFPRLATRTTTDALLDELV